jgi:hypothetical protein
MDFLIDGQISSFCPDQLEAMFLTLIMLHKLAQSPFKTLTGKSLVNFYIVNALGQKLA